MNRGEKRALISVEIENDKKNTLFELNISGDIGEDLNNVGLWDSLREGLLIRCQILIQSQTTFL